MQFPRAVSAYCCFWEGMEAKWWICSSHLQSGIGNGGETGRVNLIFSRHDKQKDVNLRQAIEYSDVSTDNWPCDMPDSSSFHDQKGQRPMLRVESSLHRANYDVSTSRGAMVQSAQTCVSPDEPVITQEPYPVGYHLVVCKSPLRLQSRVSERAPPVRAEAERDAGSWRGSLHSMLTREPLSFSGRSRLLSLWTTPSRTLVFVLSSISCGCTYFYPEAASAIIRAPKYTKKGGQQVLELDTRT